MRIIGCGNRERGDDAAGVLAVERLRELGVESLGVRTKICSGEATELMDAWDAKDDVILIDAVVRGASAGTVHSWNDGVLAGSKASASTHGFGVGEAIRLARALGRSPRSMRIYGIEGTQFDPGSPVSPEVKASVEKLARKIRAELQAADSK